MRHVRRGRRPATTTPRVVIVGTGFSGVAVAAELLRRGVRTFTLLERADTIGGVWRDNTYPGAACDVVSHLYSFSWAPEPRWSRRYATGPEILAYLRRVATDLDLGPHVRTGVEVVAATWDAASATWRVELDDGGVEVADVLVTGTGQLSRPAVPDLPGADRFPGPVFHSARWDHDARLAGRHVAVVGTGASAVQFVPVLADVAASVTVVQRTPPWVVPRRDRPYRPLEREVLARVPGLRRLVRARLFATKEGTWPVFAGRWPATALATGIARRHLRRGVPDPELRARLTPRYPIGCKRILQSDDWYPTLSRPHVRVVDGAAARLTPTGLVTDDGTEVACDAVVHGTGFRATELLAPIEVVGRDGVRLADAWRGGATAHLGMEVPGFPNLFVVYGPNTNLGHNSIVAMLEPQARYVAEAVARLRDHDLATIEIRADVHEREDTRVQRRLRRTVFASGCDSWYRDPGGRIVTNWSGTVLEYRWRTRRVAPSDHHLLARSALPVRTAPPTVAGHRRGTRP